MMTSVNQNEGYCNNLNHLLLKKTISIKRAGYQTISYQ